ncbi:MAG: RagB/SusD family nutrient uptake outer membrane protein, partial [Bacteroidota bacterium]
RAEARFLRALSYFHGLDLFGRMPLLTEVHPLNTTLPQSNRATIYNFLEGELHEIIPYLPAPGAQEYGRVDRAAVWALQARLYLNSEIYAGRVRYDECVAACEKIISSGRYRLEDDYRYLFRTDNDASAEIIFVIPFDGERIQTWGGMTYLVHAALGGRMEPLDYGVRGAWAGLRVTSGLVDHFTELDYPDLRDQFFTDGQQLEIERVNDFRHGYALPKYVNLNRLGEAGKDETFPDTDFPLFRLGEIYLTYAEATLRGGNGNPATALAYLNALRTRAGAPTPLTDEDVDLPFLLRERTRELHWEAHRRTDLVRFGLFTTGATWPWKGGMQDGQETPEYRRLFPIPEAELLANPALEQNVGY